MYEETIWQPLNLAQVCPPHSNITACTPFGYFYLNLLVQLFGGSKDLRIQEKLRKYGGEEGMENLRRGTEKYGREEYDFIVVGAGAAGCVVANRLSENKNWRVLLLEAGTEQPDITLAPSLSTALLGSNIDWKYETQPDGKSCLARPGGRCAWPRGKVMGGSSSINSMVYIRGNKLDYDGWAALGNDGWSYKEVLPFFKRSERNLDIGRKYFTPRYHGVSGEQPISVYPFVDDPSRMIVEAFHENGLPIEDYNAANQVAVLNSQAITQEGKRVSANNAFIQPIRYRRKNLTVKIKSTAYKILINNQKLAYGVKYKRNGTDYTVFARKEVILCAGSINSPKLLMLSGIGPKEHLTKLKIPVVQDLAVGENIHDHVTFNGIVVALNRTSTKVNGKVMIDELYKYKQMEPKRGPLSGNGPNNAIAFIKTDANLPAPDIQYQIGHVYVSEYIRNVSLWDSLCIFPTSFYDGMLIRAMNLVPKSRGKLLLNESNPHGDPVLYANYLKDPADLIPLIKGFKYVFNLENTQAFKNRGAYFVKTRLEPCTAYEWGSDEYLRCLAFAYTGATHHQVGSCKMGPKRDKKAVVDPMLRVYGVNRLRVIDSSIMPVVNRGNTFAPSLMIGERGVDFVIKYWLGGKRWASKPW